MPDVDIIVGGRRYAIHCRDGEEAHVARLAGVIDRKALGVRQSSSAALSEAQELLFAALLLADEVDELRRTSPSSAAGGDEGAAASDSVAGTLETLAIRLEGLAQKLAPEPPST